MKKIILLICIGLLGLNAYSQRGERHEKLKALKVGFITEELNLSTEEASVFWPIYNSYEEKLEALRKRERNEIFKEIRDNYRAMTDDQANQLIDKSLQINEQRRSLEVGLINELRQAISAKKVIQLKRVEESFKRKLLERFKERRRKN